MSPAARARGAARDLRARTFVRRRAQRLHQPAAAAGPAIETAGRYGGCGGGAAASARSRRDRAAARCDRGDGERDIGRRRPRCRLRRRLLSRLARSATRTASTSRCRRSKRAAKRYPDCEWIVANADRFVPYADATFTRVLTITARMNSSEFRRVLRDDGRLLVAIPAPDDLVELRGAGRDRVRAHDRDVRERVHDPRSTPRDDDRRSRSRCRPRRPALDLPAARDRTSRSRCASPSASTCSSSLRADATIRRPMSEPYFSVVIPTYKRLPMLLRVLDALDAQDDAPEFEVIVIDDGSGDDTAQRDERAPREKLRAHLPLAAERRSRPRAQSRRLARHRALRPLHRRRHRARAALPRRARARPPRRRTTTASPPASATPAGRPASASPRSWTTSTTTACSSATS